MNNYIRNSSALLIACLLYNQQQAADRTRHVSTTVQRMPMAQSINRMTPETSQTKVSSPTEDERKKAAILAHVAQIANSLATIAVNSKDRSNVGVQVGSVLGNALGIVMVASQRNGKTMDLQMVETYLKSMDEQTKMNIAAMIATEMNKTMRSIRA